MIVETNYSAHAVDDLGSGEQSLKTSGIANAEQISQAWSWARNTLNGAQKFRVPDGGVLLDWEGKDLAKQCEMYAQPFRLPYPAIAIEIPDSSVAKLSESQVRFARHANMHASAKTSRRIALAIEEMVDGETTISITSISLLEGVKKYMLSNFAVRLHSTGSMNAGCTYPAPAGLNVDGEGFAEFVNGQLGVEVKAVIQLIAALACKNVSTAESPPKFALNKRRIASKKTPFFLYHTLAIQREITLGDKGGHHSGGKKVRMHLRRGHVRRLLTGNIWVNSTVVGVRSNGVVDKVYSIE